MSSRTLLAAAVLLLLPASASAEPLAQTSAPTPIRAYRGEAVWSSAAGHTYTLMHFGRDGLRALPVTSAGAPVQADISRGPAGATTIVVGERDGIYVLDPLTGARRRLRAARDPESPVLWNDQLAWIEGSRTIHTATIGKPGKRRVPLPVRRAT